MTRRSPHPPDESPFRPVGSPPDREADAEAYAAACAFLRRSLEMTAERVQPVEGGWVVRDPGLAHVWDLNHLHIVRPVSTETALRIAEALLSDLPFRHIQADDQPTGERLARELRPAGWRVETLAVMALGGDPAPPGDGSPAVVDVGETEVMALMRRWDGEALPDASEEMLDQLVQHDRRVGAAWGERRFGVRAPDGELVAITKLRSDGTTAQVEDVYTVPEWRRHGCARSLVTHAARQAATGDHRLVFIVADDDDWPKLLYAEVGFRPVGWIRSLHRGQG